MIHYGDVTKIKGSEVPKVDVITFGAPCQDLSVAGKRAGMKNVAMGDDETTRSGLFFEAIRIIKEMREDDRRNNAGTDNDRRFVRPRFAVYENVPGAFSSNKGEDFRAVLEETAKVADKDAVIPGPPNGKWSHAGCIMGDGWSIAWRVHDAQFWGVPQRRKRIALVADFGGFTAPEILFERKGVSGDTEESGKEGEGSAGDAGAGTKESSRVIGFHLTQDPVSSEELSYAVSCGSSTYGQCVNGVVYGIGGYNSEGMKSKNPHAGIYEADTIRTLDNNGSNPACNQGGMVVLCDAYQHHGYRESGTCGTLTAEQNQRIRGDTPIVLEGNGSRPSHKGDGYSESEVSYTLNSTEHHAVCIKNHPADSRVKISDDGKVQTLSGRMGTGGGNVPMVMEPHTFSDVAATLSAADGSKGVHSQMMKNPEQNFILETSDGEIAGTLDASYYKGCGLRQGRERTIIAEPITLNSKQDEEMVGQKTAGGSGAVCAAVDMRNSRENTEINGTLQAKDNGGWNANSNTICRVNSIVRRLTPLECTRLQGFPDGWVDIGEWVDSKGKVRKDSDANKYKALGNSIALPFWEWMAKRMIKVLNVDHPTMASLFDGISGFCLVFARAGAKPVFSSEIEEYPIAVAKKHFGDDDLGLEGDYERYT